MSELKEVNERQTSAEVQAKMIANRMQYQMPPNVDISKHSTYVVDVSQVNVYAQNQEMIFDVHSIGTSFVDFQRSWLSFTLQNVLTAAGAALGAETTFGALGSAHNLIQEVLVTSRSGQELCRLRGANLYNNRNAFLEKPREYFETVGKMSGFPPLDYTGPGGLGTHPTQSVENLEFKTVGRVIRYTIPLKDICGVFDQPSLVPGIMTENMRIRILLAPTNTVFVGGDVATYQLGTPEIHWRIIQAGDQYVRAVSVAASQEGGLTLSHTEVYQDITTATATSYNWDLKKAAGSATKVVVIPRLVSNINVLAQDSMACAPYDFLNAQHHIGSDYFPQIALQSRFSTGNNVDLSDFYPNEMDVYGAVKYSLGCPNVPYGILIHDYGYTGGYSLATQSTCLLKNDASLWAGYWISNSRALVMQIVFRTSVARELDTYLSHLRIVKVFPNQISVSD